ncbi:MAG: hypothetical protein AB7V10_09450 [Leucobacter sp.]
MTIITQTLESSSVKFARLRQQRWDRQVASFWHEYAPTPETQARLDAATLAVETR